MSTWVCAVRIKLQSEFRDFELVQAYTVSDTPRAVVATGKPGLRQEFEQKQKTSASIKRRLERLANFYGLDAPRLVREYFSLTHLLAHLVRQDIEVVSLGGAWLSSFGHEPSRSNPGMVFHPAWV